MRPVRPCAITADPTPPQVAFTGFEVFNTQVPIGAAADRFTLARSILTTADLRLSHREKIVTFTFAGLHFGAPRAARYAYRLDGWDDAWTEADAQRRSATWTNLPPGRYVLRVRAANKDGVWSEPGAAMAIRVLPPPWRTWWAYTSRTFRPCPAWRR